MLCALLRRRLRILAAGEAEARSGLTELPPAYCSCSAWCSCLLLALVRVAVVCCVMRVLCALSGSAQCCSSLFCAAGFKISAAGEAEVRSGMALSCYRLDLALLGAALVLALALVLKCLVLSV